MKAAGIVLAWIAVVTGLHLWLNVDWESVLNDSKPEAERKLNVAYIPVTCHIACPVTDYVADHSDAGRMFLPKQFQGFPEIKEALIANRVQAGFLVAPMAIALVAQGVPIHIVYLGHRYGSALVVKKDGPVQTVRDLAGKTIAIPSRFSDERLITGRALEANQLHESDVKMGRDGAARRRERAERRRDRRVRDGRAVPVAGAARRLRARAVLRARVLAGLHLVRARRARRHHQVAARGAAQLLVDGIARSGMWLDGGKPHREYAAEFVGRYYFQQPPRVLRWALTNPMDRVMYTPLSPTKGDFDEIVAMMVKAKLIDKPIPFEQFVDTSFAEKTHGLSPWKFEPGNDWTRAAERDASDWRRAARPRRARRRTRPRSCVHAPSGASPVTVTSAPCAQPATAAAVSFTAPSTVMPALSTRTTQRFALLPAPDPAPAPAADPSSAITLALTRTEAPSRVRTCRTRWRARSRPRARRA